MKIRQIENFNPASEIIIRDNKILSGFLPEFLRETAHDAIRQGDLERLMANYCNGLGNHLSLRNGNGLEIVEDETTLDAEDAQTEKPKPPEKLEPISSVNSMSDTTTEISPDTVKARSRTKGTRKQKAAATNLDGEVEREEDLTDAITTAALKPSNVAIGQWVKLLKTQVDQWVADGVPMPEIRDRIPSLYERLDSGKLAKVLTQGMQLGYLGGLGEEDVQMRTP